MASTTYRIGTRGSLLAVTQTELIKQQLEEKTRDQFEIVTIKTQGDLNTSAPLWQLEGKDFFTKELDQALLSGEVDLVIHSYKDLGSERPKGISLAAVTKRSFAHDILLIKTSTIANLSQMNQLNVGTSSPRRITNIESMLSDFLPAENIQVKTSMLRGNINTRIQKLQEDQYDAIVLALPGLERLGMHNEAKYKLKDLLNGLNFMILPRSVFPSAASQGALGIEVATDRNDNNELLKKIKLIEDRDTVEEVQRERESFQSYGGGCHLAVGINVLKRNEYFVHFEKGQVDQKNIFKIQLERPEENKLPSAAGFSFLGMPIHKVQPDPTFIYDEYIQKEILEDAKVEKNLQYFVTSNYCIDNLPGVNEVKAIWASGSKTFKSLVEKGYWVNGSADQLGHEEVAAFLSSETIKILTNQTKCLLLSHDQAQSDQFETCGQYTRKYNKVSDGYLEQLRNCQHFYWTSYSQYERFCQLLPEIKKKTHCCGLGKTFAEFKNNKIKVYPFYSLLDYKKWCQSQGT